MKNLYLNTPQAEAELEKCLQCTAKPCMHACPASVSPKDFIGVAQQNNWHEAARLIYEQNPIGEICGLICPDTFCIKACTRAKIDAPIRIQALQALIMQKARVQNMLLEDDYITKPNGKKIAVIGSGPAGIGAVSVLLRHGYAVTVFEKNNILGGALNLIPEARLPREIITYEWQRLTQNPLLNLQLNREIKDYDVLLQTDFTGVIVASGEQKPRTLGIDGEEFALSYTQYLAQPYLYATSEPIAVIGGGAVAVDCAVTAKSQKSAHVEMFVRRRLDNMRITPSERQSLLAKGINITTMTRPIRIEKSKGNLILWTTKTRFDENGKLQDEPNTSTPRTGFKQIIFALGSTRAEKLISEKRIIYAGDIVTGGSTAVQAVANGKQAAENLIDIIQK